MSRRRSLNRRSSRQSLNNTGVLNNDSNVFDRDDPLYYRDMLNQTNASRPSAAFSLANSSRLDPDSRVIDSTRESGEWWNVLDKTDDKLLPPSSNSQATSQKPANERESIGVVLTESDNQTREIKKRRMRKVRRTRQSRGENLYAQALGESEKAVESEPTFFTKPRVKGKISISYDEHLPSNTSTESEKPRKKRPNILNYRAKNRRVSVNYDEIVGDESIVGPSQPNTQQRQTLSLNKSETMQIPQKALCETLKITPRNLLINPVNVISESDDDDSPDKNVSRKARFTLKHSQNLSNPYEDIITDDDEEEEDEEIDIPEDLSDSERRKLSVSNNNRENSQEKNGRKSRVESSSFIENTEDISRRISANGNLSSNRSTPSVSEKDYSLNRNVSQDRSSNSSISEELKISGESPKDAESNKNISSSSGNRIDKSKLGASSFVEDTRELETVDTDVEENEEETEDNVEENKKKEDVEKSLSKKSVKSVEKNKQKGPPVFNESSKDWQTVDNIDVDNEEKDSPEFTGTTKELKTIEDGDSDDEPLIDKSQYEKTRESRLNNSLNQSLSSRRTRSSKSIGKNLDDNVTKNSFESSPDENKENNSSEKIELSKSVDKSLNKLSPNNSRESSRKAGSRESTVTSRKSRTKKSLNESNESQTSRQKSLSKIQDESTINKSKNKEMNVKDDSENDEEDVSSNKTPRRSLRIRNSSVKISEDKSVEVGGDSKSQRIVDDNSSSDESDSSGESSRTDPIVDPSAYELPSVERSGSFHISQSEDDEKEEEEEDEEKEKESNSQLKNESEINESKKKSILSTSSSSTFKIHKRKFAAIDSDDSQSEEEKEGEKNKKKRDSSREKSFVETQENDSKESNDKSDIVGETHPDIEKENSKILEKKKKSLQLPDKPVKSLDSKKNSKENQHDAIVLLENVENSLTKTPEKSKDREKSLNKSYKPGPRFTKSFSTQQPLSPVVIIATQEDQKTPELSRQKTPSLSEKRKRPVDQTEDQDVGQSASVVHTPKKSLKSLTASERKSLRSSNVKEAKNSTTKKMNQTNIINFFKPLSNTKRPETEFDKKIIEAKKQLDIKTKKDEELTRILDGKEKKGEIIVEKNPLKTMLMARKKLENKNDKKVIDKAYLIDGRLYKAPRLPRPKHWATDRLYKYLWKLMEPKYGLSTRVKSEKFIKDLAESVTLIERRKKYENYVEELDGLILKMAKLGLIKTRLDFNHFCYDFLPYEFREKVVPILRPGGKTNIPWDPKTLNDPII